MNARQISFCVKKIDKNTLYNSSDDIQDNMKNNSQETVILSTRLVSVMLSENHSIAVDISRHFVK